MRKVLIVFISFCTVLSVTGCTHQPSVEELIDKEVDKKLEKFKEKKRSNCKEYIISEAEKEVDSTMYIKIGSTLDHSVSLPQKPERPEDSLAYEVTLDTGNVLELLPDSIEVDSLK